MEALYPSKRLIRRTGDDDSQTKSQKKKLGGWFRRLPVHPNELKSLDATNSVQIQSSTSSIPEFVIQHLPDDVLMGIFSNLLELSDVPVLMRVCRSWTQILDDSLLWKKRWFNRWNLSVLSGGNSNAIDWKFYCMEHHLAESSSPSHTLPSWNTYGVSSARIEEGPISVYFSPIVANVKLCGGRWVYEVDITEFSLKKYLKKYRPKKSRGARLLPEEEETSNNEEINHAYPYFNELNPIATQVKHSEDEEFSDDQDEENATDDKMDVDGEGDDNSEGGDEDGVEPEAYLQRRTIYSGSLIAQVGFVTMGFFSPQLDMYGVGDDRHSWGYDGCRRFLFYGGIVRRRGAESQVHRLRYAPDTRWNVGDTVGVAIQIEENETRLEYFLNGTSLGLAPCEIHTPYHAGGFYPALSRSRSGDKAQYVFRFGSPSAGGKLKYDYPGYTPVACDSLERLNPVDTRLKSHKTIRVSPLIPHLTDFPTHSFAVSVVADAEEISYMSWDEGVVRARVEFIQGTEHPMWSVVYGYNSRQYTRVIRYLKWDGTKWSARIVFDSRSGKHTLCHWPAGDQDRRDFAMESDFSADSEGSDDDENYNADEGEQERAPSKPREKVTKISDNTEDLLFDIASPSWVAPAGSYFDPALTYRGNGNSRCTACPVDMVNNPTSGFKKEDSWIPPQLRRF